MIDASSLYVSRHPLVQHKLSLMRDKQRSTAGFRRLLREISLLLCYEVTRDLPLTTVTIETPITTMEARGTPAMPLLVTISRSSIESCVPSGTSMP